MTQPIIGKALLTVDVKQVGPRTSIVNYGGYQDFVVDNVDLDCGNGAADEALVKTVEGGAGDGEL